MRTLRAVWSVMVRRLTRTVASVIVVMSVISLPDLLVAQSNAESLTVKHVGAGTGTTRANVGLLSCPGNCSDTYGYNTNVVLMSTTDHQHLGGRDLQLESKKHAPDFVDSGQTMEWFNLRPYARRINSLRLAAILVPLPPRGVVREPLGRCSHIQIPPG